MIAFINSLTGTEMLVADDRKEEYLAAGHMLAAGASKAEKPEAVKETKKAPAKKPTKKK